MGRNISFAFGFLATLVLFQNCGELQNHVKFQNIPKVPDLKLDAGKFSSCSEIEKWQKDVSDRQSRLFENAPIATGLSDSSMAQTNSLASSPTASPTSSITNRQEADVDEPDLVKADSQYIYYSRGRSIEVISKSTFQVLQSEPLEDVINIQLFLEEDRLFVIGQDPYRIYTRIKSFSISNGHLTPGGEIKLSGYLTAARLASGEMTLVISRWTPIDLAAFSNGLLFGVPCGNISRPLLDDLDLTLTIVHKIQTATLQVQSLGLFGQTNNIYMTKNNLYLSSNGFNWYDSDSRLMSSDLYQSQILRKIDVRPGHLSFEAAGTVKGHTKDQWSYHEKGENLYVATTYTANPFTNSRRVSNRLSVLRQTAGTRHLKIVGESAEFGVTEEIKSVRFVGDMAYVVTFRQTDPLLTFDLSSGDTPKLLGELIVPGFSSYLHPVAAGRLLGVGYSSESANSGRVNGTQVSLFDVSKPAAPDVLIQYPVGQFGSESPANHDHHAFYYSEGLAGLPVRIYGQNYQYSFTGALLLQVTDSIKEAARVSHSVWRPSPCYGVDVDRIVKSGRYLMTLSPLGLKVIDPQGNYGTVFAAPFKNLEKECLSRQPAYAI